jgi:acetyl-CoA synthetase
MNPMTQPKPATATFRAARDLLLRHREDYDAAIREFSWPGLDAFNWALDWFDVIAAEHPGQEALRVVTEDGTTTLTYGELAARSSQAANWLRSLGARRGDRLLLMLGNIAPLWEVILAAIKLGVVIIPASTLLSPEDLADRIERGEVRHVVTEEEFVARSPGSAGTGPASSSAPGPARRLQRPAGTGIPAHTRPAVSSSRTG